MKLSSNSYGKGRVRVMRVTRAEDGKHIVYEVEVAVMLEGDFSETYLTGDNSRVVPTDTIKNTVLALAHSNLTGVIEEFALYLSTHFLSKYDQITKVDVELTSRTWRRFQTTDGPHPHTFIGDSNYTSFTHVVHKRGEEVPSVESGVKNLIVMKTTNSAFKGYSKCEFTTLPETDDRVMATSMDATWSYDSLEVDYLQANGTILLCLLNSFAKEFSHSLQNTLYLMARSALETAPEISQIRISMPNKHYLTVNLEPFGLENDATIFLPTDEPYGQIEASVVRSI